MVFQFFSDDPITEEVDKATDEKNTEENWGMIMEICDKAGKNSEDAKKYLKAIIRRLYHEDPHVAIQAVVLLDACVKNSGRKFHMEVASRDFENDFTKLMTKAHQSAVKKMKECLKRWSENEFKNDSSLNLIPSLYAKLKSSGIDFNFSSDTPPKKSATVNKNPDVVDSNEEEEQIMKAIELSLKESTGSPRSVANTTSTSLYPSTNLSTVSNVSLPPSTSSQTSKEPKKVQALYDFEAAEDNELTFSAGDMIYVIDDSDPNWWKGTNQKGGEGLFPSNFVTSDLNVEPEKFLFEKAKKIVQFKESVDVKIDKESQEIEINEEKIDRLLHLMHEADPTNPERDTEEMLVLEQEVNAMGPLIDTELERVDRKHAQLTQLSADLVEALNLYHTLMREPVLPSMSKLPYGFPPSSAGYNGPASLPMMGPGSLPPGMNQPPYVHPGAPPTMHYGPAPPMMPPPPQHIQQMAGTSGQMPMHSMPPQQQQMMPNHHLPQGAEMKPDPNVMHYQIPNFGAPAPVPQNYRLGAQMSSHTVIQNGGQPSSQYNNNPSNHSMM